MKRIQNMHRHPKSGMTLVELIVAFALLAIVGALLSGAIVYAFRTSVYSSSKTSASLLTVGELVSYVNGGGSQADVAIATDESLNFNLVFNGVSIPVPGTFVTATSNQIIRNSSQSQRFKVFIP